MTTIPNDHSPSREQLLQELALLRSRETKRLEDANDLVLLRASVHCLSEAIDDAYKWHAGGLERMKPRPPLASCSVPALEELRSMLPPKHEPTSREDPYVAGYACAAGEIASGEANDTSAKERGLYPQNQDDRIDWDRGYEDACIAYRLGHDPRELATLELYGVSLFSTATVVTDLLDGKGLERVRPDPRKRGGKAMADV